ncbi:MAG: P-loop NTPase [Halodesulfurarchaeum sp.]
MKPRRVFAVSSAKGGVGKTTVSLNLGASLAEFGPRIAVVELDLAMANMVDFVDLERPAGELPTLHDVLSGFTAIDEAIYEAPGGFDIIPSGVDLDGFVESDPEGIPLVVDQLKNKYDVVILDTGAGLTRETILGFDRTDHVLLVSTPRVASVRDTEKTLQLAKRRGADVGGIIFNKSGTGRAPGVDRIAEYLDTDLLGHVPEDRAVPAAQDRGRPVIVDAPGSPAATAYHEIASELSRYLNQSSEAEQHERGGIRERLPF